MTDKERARWDSAELQWEAFLIEAAQVELPDDLQGMIADWRRYIDSLPEELPQKRTMAFHLDYAEAEVKRGNLEQVRIAMLRVSRNYQPAEHDRWLSGLQRQFGKDAEARRQQVDAERRPEWDRWQEEADKIQAASRIPLSKSELARRVKTALDLPDAERTIRNRLK